MVTERGSPFPMARAPRAAACPDGLVMFGIAMAKHHLVFSG
ncbi:hypothetical protein [Bradyrhizobium sp. NC92]|nr:hypothetical protein [Bradyrhizobium sp. NC92]UWU72575.1 hypothetical protein N2602_19225 [Bradyrhizobium sp. NC92]